MATEESGTRLEIPSLESIRATIKEAAHRFVHLMDRSAGELSVEEAAQLLADLGILNGFSETLRAEVELALAKARPRPHVPKEGEQWAAQCPPN